MKNASKGINFNDRVLAGKLRTKVMQEIFLVVNEDAKAKKFGAYKKQMLLTLAKSILPRLNEVTGDSGSPIVFELSNVLAKKHGINTHAGSNSG